MPSASTLSRPHRQCIASWTALLLCFIAVPKLTSTSLFWLLFLSRNLHRHPSRPRAVRDVEEVSTIDFFQEAVGRVGQLYRSGLSMASPSPRLCFAVQERYAVARRLSSPTLISASSQLRFHSSEQLASNGSSRRLASSPVPKNDSDDCAGENTSSNFRIPRFASFHPACQLGVAPRLYASSRKRAL